MTNFVVAVLFAAVLNGIVRAKDFLSARQAALLANEPPAPTKLLYYSHVCLVVGGLWYALGAMFGSNMAKGWGCRSPSFQCAGVYLQAAGALMMAEAVVVASALIAIGDEAGATQILNMRPYFVRAPAAGQTVDNSDKGQTV